MSELMLCSLAGPRSTTEMPGKGVQENQTWCQSVSGLGWGRRAGLMERRALLPSSAARCRQPGQDSHRLRLALTPAKRR